MSKIVHNRKVFPEMEEGKMKTKGLAQQMIDGSRRLNQMREEIQLIVRMVAAFLYEEGVMSKLAPKGTITLGVECTWQFHKAHLRPDEAEIIYAICGNIVLQYDPASRGNLQLNSCYVSKVHRALDVLVEHMLEKFPHAAATWSPLFEIVREE